MTSLHAPWLTLAVALPLVGAMVVGRLRSAERAFRWTLAFNAAALACSLAAALDFYLGGTSEARAIDGLSVRLFSIDELSAPLVPLIALLHFLRTVATAQTQLRRSSFALALAAESIRLAIFCCREPWPLIALLAVDALPPLVELLARRRPIRVYVVHMGIFIVLMVGGWALAGTHGGLSAVLLLGAVLVRSGAVPLHCWLTDLFEHATLGTAMLFATPLAGAYLAIRLVLPIAPDWILRSLAVVSLTTAVYAACMATVQREARRFYAYLFLSHASLVLVGLEMNTAVSLTGALALWVSVALALGGFGLTLRALEARYGRLSLADFRGLYEQSPALAICFLMTGLASIGFPGTLGFVGAEMLVDGAVEANPLLGVAVVVAAAVNGIALLRAYFLLFTGTRHASKVSMTARPRERFAVLTLAVLIFAGGLVPQPGIATRRRAADAILLERRRLGFDTTGWATATDRIPESR